MQKIVMSVVVEVAMVMVVMAMVVAVVGMMVVVRPGGVGSGP